jgi:aminopeptidase N
MKNKIHFIMLFGFLTISSFAQENAEDICSSNKIQRYRSLINFDESKYLSKSEFSYDVKYYRLEFEVDPAVWAIKGAVTTWFDVTGDNFQTMSLDLTHNGLIVDSILYHQSKITNFTHTNNELTIPFPSIIANGVLDSLTVYYQGIPDANGFGSFVQTTHNGVPVIWTLSEPYGARDWWPCKQSLNDKADSIDIYITHPDAYKAASNGVLVSESAMNNLITAHWKHRHPITAYLVAIAVTNYAVYSDFVTINTGDEVEVLNYVFPENLAYAQENTPNVLDVIQLYSNLFIPYPYKNEKYGHAEFGRGGGMEHQTMSFMGGFSHGLMAHELAHQWFGDFITCGSWGDIWLNEGFATYLDGLTHEYYLNDNGVDFNTWKQSKITQITSYPDGSVFCDDTTNINRIFSSRLSYSKGALVLHMIRKKIGDENFYAAMQNYLNDPAIADGYAHTVDFRLHCEQTYGNSLVEFFNDWIYGEGFPLYDIYYSQDNNGNVRININQSQSDPSVGFFEMDVPLKFHGVDKDTVIILNNSENGQSYNFNLDFVIVSGEFDPSHDIVSIGSNVLQIDTFNDRNRFYIMPNPAKNEITITFLENILPEKVIVYDNFGKKVLEFGNYKNSSLKYNFDISSLQAGMYIVSFYKEKNCVSKKFVKY